MHRPTGFGQVLAHRLLHTQRCLFPGQLQLDQLQRRDTLAPLWRATELACQAWQHAFQRLHFQGVGRRRRQLQRQCMCLGPLLAALQHPHLADARLGMAALRVHSHGLRPVAQALALLAQSELQARMAPGQPWVVAVQALHGCQDRQRVVALLQALGALVQGHGQIDFGALLQGTRIGAERHLFVAQQAEVGEDEVRPVLVQVAEEQQAHAVAQGLQAPLEDAHAAVRKPLGQ
ncbi:hypothetical protein D3C72_1085850 [compost metagenome]